MHELHEYPKHSSPPKPSVAIALLSCRQTLVILLCDQVVLALQDFCLRARKHTRSHRLPFEEGAPHTCASAGAMHSAAASAKRF